MPQPAHLSAARNIDRGQRDRFAWVMLCSLALLAAMALPYYSGHVYLHDDLAAYHLPVRAFYAQCLAAGRPFDWMPQLYSGMYLTGEGQAGVYHPLHLLLYGSLSLRAAFALEVLLSYPLMLAGMYFFLRRRMARRDAALLGAMVFTFSGFNLLHLMHLNAVAVVAHIPWLLWAIDVALREANRRKAIAAELAVVLLTASQILLGYPQYVWFSLLAEVAVVGVCIYGTIPARRASEGIGETGSPSLARRASIVAKLATAGLSNSAVAIRLYFPSLTRLTAAKLLGLMIAAIQLLPTLDAFSNSARRTVDADFVNTGSLAPLNLLQLIAPYLWKTRVAGQNTHELGLYCGAVPLMLVVWLIVRRRSLGRYRPAATSVLALGSLALLLAMGGHTPLYRLQSWLPVVGGFRFPARAIMLFHLSLAIAAAMSFALLHRRSTFKTGVTARQCLPLWLVVVASVAIAAVAPLLWPQFTSGVALVWLGPMLLALAAALVTLAAGGVRGASIALIVLTAVDLGTYGLSYSVYPHTARLDKYVVAVASADEPIDLRGEKVSAAVPQASAPALRTGNQVLLAGASRVGGYAGLEPVQRLDYSQLSALRAAGVSWMRRPTADNSAPGELRDWIPVTNSAPRARLVSRAMLSDEPSRDIEQIDLKHTALVDRPIDLTESLPGVSHVVQDRPGQIDLIVNAPARQLLVVTERFHTGWQAEIDGRPQPLLRANGDFIGCVIEPGRHDVRLVFRPYSLQLGKSLSAYGLGLLGFCLVIRCAVFSRRSGIDTAHGEPRALARG
ncbi:MAG: YfhO family protein [Planctomycetes bacterium]|nr:YfhO family protein [Planctomycetota bacterium]